MIGLLSTYSLAHAELTIHPDSIEYLKRVDAIVAPAVGNYQFNSTKYECLLKKGGVTPINKSLKVELEILDRAYQTYELIIGLKSISFSSIEDLIAYAKTADADPKRGWGLKSRSNVKAIIDGKEIILSATGAVDKLGRHSWNVSLSSGSFPGLPGLSKKSNRILDVFVGDEALSMELFQQNLSLALGTKCIGEKSSLIAQ
jgi:hypothetical protein